MVANGRPFGPADDTDILDGKDGEEQVLVGPIIPILVHDFTTGSLAYEAQRSNQIAWLELGWR